MRSLILFLNLAFFVCLALQLYSQEENSEIIPKTKTYTTQKIKGTPPDIDGVLNDSCWQNNNWSGNFTQWIPNEGATPTYPTYINILYDNRNIYVAIRAVDYEPEKIIKKRGRRDELTGDMVGINFDSYHDHRTGFEFNVTAAGQKIDMILTNPMNGDQSWDAVWTAKVGFEDTAWVAEFEIPLSQLRYSSESEQTWGMHVWRWLDRLQEESDWEPQSSTGPGMLYLFGHLEGIEGLPKSKRIEMMPYLLGKISTVEKDLQNPYAKNGYNLFGSFGVDAKIGLSSNFTADITINPDFGQVESDPSEMNLTAFETFYNEKRPFFLEGKNIFEFETNGTSLFYSRRIGQSPSYYPVLSEGEYMSYPNTTSIISAVKISGKTSKGFSMGILQSITNNETAKISNGISERKELVEPLTSFTVARFQKDFNEGNTILGGIGTATNRLSDDTRFSFLNRNAFSGGLDFLHQWNDKEFFIDARLMGSFVNGDSEAMQILQTSSARYYQRPDAEHIEYNDLLTQLSGYGGKIEIGKGSKGFWRYSTSLSFFSPGFEVNDLGYMQLADVIQNRNQVSYFINQPKGIIRALNTSFTQINNWDFALNYLSAHFSYSFSTQFLNRWSINTHACHFPESTDTKQLRGGPSMKMPSKTHATLQIGSDGSKRFSASLYGFYEWGGENSLSQFTFHPSINYHPIDALRISLSGLFTTNRNELQYVDKTYLAQQPVYILGEINQQTLSATFRIDYIITPELSIQYYGSPFVSVGSYSDYKIITDPLNDSYDSRFRSFQPVFKDINNNFSDEGGFYNPDFSFTQFRSNLVFRWEYLPGSKLYLVWSNEQTNYQNEAGKTIDEVMNNFGNAFANNLFLLKLNYWFSL
ncbi:MAG: carbohydrate binding family 9 domain-containing protein [Prolixibacteraceae bacterium]|nr:carbohydrate binding family 9 domain-containing protein [Prolixibacteraceae bacterium]